MATSGKTAHRRLHDQPAAVGLHHLVVALGDLPLLVLVGDQHAAAHGGDGLQCGNARSRRAPGCLLHRQAGHARLLDGADQAVVREGHAVAVVDVPAAAQVDLPAAIVGAPVIEEAHFLAPQHRHAGIPVRVDAACRSCLEASSRWENSHVSPKCVWITSGSYVSRMCSSSESSSRGLSSGARMWKPSYLISRCLGDGAGGIDVRPQVQFPESRQRWGPGSSGESEVLMLTSCPSSCAVTSQCAIMNTLRAAANRTGRGMSAS